MWKHNAFVLYKYTYTQFWLTAYSCITHCDMHNMNLPEPDVFSPTGMKVASLTVQAPVCVVPATTKYWEHRFLLSYENAKTDMHIASSFVGKPSLAVLTSMPLAFDSVTRLPRWCFYQIRSVHPSIFGLMFPWWQNSLKPRLSRAKPIA